MVADCHITLSACQVFIIMTLLDLFSPYVTFPHTFWVFFTSLDLASPHLTSFTIVYLFSLQLDLPWRHDQFSHHLTSHHTDWPPLDLTSPPLTWHASPPDLVYGTVTCFLGIIVSLVVTRIMQISCKLLQESGSGGTGETGVREWEAGRSVSVVYIIVAGEEDTWFLYTVYRTQRGKI